jgi:hypothetical protein
MHSILDEKEIRIARLKVTTLANIYEGMILWRGGHTIFAPQFLTCARRINSHIDPG